jgi:hypothetical protein
MSDSVDDYMKGCHTRTVAGCVWHVDQFSPTICTSI